jgi:hypothetical protein
MGASDASLLALLSSTLMASSSPLELLDELAGPGGSEEEDEESLSALRALPRVASTLFPTSLSSLESADAPELLEASRAMCANHQGPFTRVSVQSPVPCSLCSCVCVRASAPRYPG